MLSRVLMICMIILVFCEFVFAQNSTTQVPQKALPWLGTTGQGFPEIPVFYYPGDDAAKGAKPAPKAQPTIDPVATGLRSDNGNPVPIVTASIRSIAINEDGTLLAIGTGDGEILIWSKAASKMVARWKGHEKWVFDLIFDSNSKTLISGGGDRYTKLWSVGKWERVSQARDHEDDVHGVAITADSKRLITGGDDTLVIVRDLATGEITKLEGHDAQVTSLVLDQVGNRVFSASRDATIRAWDLDQRKQTQVLKGHTEDVLHLAIDRSGRFLASASYDGSVRVWSLDNLQTVQTLKVPDVWMLSVEFSADANTLFVGSTDFQVRAFDRESGKDIWKSKTVSDPSDIVLSPDGKTLYVSSAASGIFVYNATDPKGTVLRKIAVTQSAAPGVAPISTEEYLQMHDALLYMQDKKEWAVKVGLLSIHGDQFTDHLLKNMDVTQLPAPKRELANRLRNGLQAKYEPFEGTPISTRVLKKFWGQYAATEYYDMQISAPLMTWLRQETARTKKQARDGQFDAGQFEEAIKSELSSISTDDQSQARKLQVEEEVLNQLKELLAE